MRSALYASRPSAEVIRNIGRIHRQEVRFIIEPCGPTKFRVKQIYPVTSKAGTIYTVSIGNAQLCTCGSQDICIHILYVLIRYFGVPKNSEILYQRTLSDREIESLLEGHYIGYSRTRQRRQQQHSPARSRQESGPTPTREYFYQPIPQPSSALSYITERFLTKPKVQRIKFTSNDLCPICYDALSECSISEIAWCSHGCGGNFHAKCVQEWIDTKNSTGEHGSCPLCRVPIDNPDISSAPNQKEFEDSFKECQEHSADSSCTCIHSQGTCCSSQNNNHLHSHESVNENENISVVTSQNDSTNSSVLKPDNELLNYPHLNQEAIYEDYQLATNYLSEQLEQIENFLNTARNQLKEHQRRVQSQVEAHVRAGARSRSNLRDGRGRPVEPVLKLKVPVFDPTTATINQSDQKRLQQAKKPNPTSPNNHKTALPRMIESSTINGSNRNLSNDVQQKPRVVSFSSPSTATRIIQKKEISSNSSSIRTSKSSPVSIQSFENNPTFDHLDTHENNATCFPNQHINNENYAMINNESLINDEILESPNIESALRTKDEANVNINNTYTSSNSTIDVHSRMPLSLVERFQQQNQQPKMIAQPLVPSSASNIHAIKSSPLLSSHSGRTTSNSEQEANKLVHTSSSSESLTSNELNTHNNSQRNSTSSLSSAKETEFHNESPKRTTISKPKTINMNELFLNSTLSGNITDGLTLAQMQARENEIRLQRTLNPGLNSIGFAQKRSSKSRLQPRHNANETNTKRKQLQAYAGWSS